MARKPAFLIASVLAVAAAGCSTVTDYTRVTSGGQRAFADLDFNRAAKAYEKGTDCGLDRLCYLYELGTVLHMGGEFKESNERFQEAVRTVREFDNRATISARDTASGAGTLILNEKTEPYRGESFERVYAHVFAALNYLLMGDLTGARVEARQAFHRQKLERLRFQDEYDEAVRQSRAKNALSSKALSQAEKRYGASANVSKVELFQDAFSYYLASVIYEIKAEYNNGQVEMRNLLKFRGASKAAREQAARLETKSKYAGLPGGKKGAERLLPKEGEGEVIIFYLCGQAPIKKEVKLNIPIPTGRGHTINTVAFPKYENRTNPVALARVRVGKAGFGGTEVLSDVQAKAHAALGKRLPVLVMKSVIRAVGRHVAQRAVLESGPRPGKRGDKRRDRRRDSDKAVRELAALMIGVVGSIVEQADLRSWLSLPKSFQVARGVAPAGRHSFTIDLLSAGGSHVVSASKQIEVKARRVTVVVVRSIGARAVIRSRVL